MSDTPETDAAIKSSNGQWSFVLKDTCKRLERERDEAREALLNLSALVRRLFALLETVEVSDSEREFHPTVIRSCRVAHTSELAELLPQIKEAVK